jgi:uncharacterized protein DUF4126
MHLAFDICTGIGVAAAVGIRPFLPAAIVSALALAGVDGLKGTNYHWLQSVPFLLGMILGAIVLEVLERALKDDGWRGQAGWICAAAGVVLGAVYFASSLCRGGYAVWPGYVGGAVCAVIAVLASRPFLARLRSRLDAEAAALGVPLVAEGSAALLGALSVLAPPVGPIGLLAMLLLWFRGRGRDDQKYAGLRILR